MEIKRNQSIEDWAMGEVQNNWGSEAREGIHLSDLLAPRRAYWQKIKPMKPTLKEISYWTSGSAIEDKFLKAIGYKKGEEKEWQGILYNADVFLGNLPAEIKSRRRALAKEGEEAQMYDHYLKQLKGYCAVENKQKGWLIVLSLAEKQDNNKTMPEWRYYDVMFTEEELMEEQARLINARASLMVALERKDHTFLPECPHWMCGKTLKIMETKSFCMECSREFEKEGGRERHLNSKTGKGHNVSLPTFREEYEKECKYWETCLSP